MKMEELSRSKNLNKKGVSLLIGYVLLIVIAIALSTIVYAYLKLYIPKERAECPNDISLFIDETSCVISAQEIKFTLSNTGFFNVSGAFLKIGPEDRAVKFQLNRDKEIFSDPLSPGSELEFVFEIPNELNVVENQRYEIEVEPAQVIERKLVPCENAIVNQPITCTQNLGTNVPAHCSNSVQDGDEEGQNCGGSCPNSCIPPICDGDGICESGETEACTGDCACQDPQCNGNMDCNCREQCSPLQIWICPA